MAHVFMAAYTDYHRDPRVKREARALAAEDHEVTFMARRVAGSPDNDESGGVRLLNVLPERKKKPDSGLAYLIEYALFFLALMAHLCLHPRRYALIHINNMPDFLAFAAWLPRLMGAPLIHDIHDLMPEIYMEKFKADARHPAIRMLLAQERWAGRIATAVLTVEENLRVTLSKRGIPKEKITVLLNLPDESVFAPRAAAPDHQPGDKFVVVYHGTLARRLGLDFAIEAAAKLRERIPGLELRIIGGGEELARLQELARKLDLESVVTFSGGYVPVEQVSGLIADADIAVIPLRKLEATEIMLPTKLLEYALVGIPSIVPPTATVRQYFDETMVRFFEAENVGALAEAILDLYEHPEKRAALREGAKRFNSQYAWSAHKKVYTDLVARLLAGK